MAGVVGATAAGAEAAAELGMGVGGCFGEKPLGIGSSI